MSCELEIWAVIPGFPVYEISTFGVVRRCVESANGVPVGKVLKPWITRNGYVQVGLQLPNGKAVRHGVHRLLALTFLGDPPFEKAHAAHEDGCRTHNVLSNIRWSTPKDNSADIKRHGRSATGLRNGAHTKPECVLRGESNGSSKLTEVEVAAIRIDGRPSRRVAAAYGISKTNVLDIRRRHTWKHVA